MSDKKVNISISLNANPSPNITVVRVDGGQIWEKDSRVTIGDAFIVFQSLTESDATNYTVLATNDAGDQKATFCLSCEFNTTMEGAYICVHT